MIETEFTQSTARTRSTSIDVAIALSTAAAFAHAVAAPSHLEWWPASGVFFVALACIQAAYSLALLRSTPSARLMLIGVWGTVAVIVLYVISRTVGLPFAPGVPAHGASAQPGQAIIPDGDKFVGPLDLFTLVVEVLLVMVLVGLLPARQRSRTANRLLWSGATIWAGAALALVA